MAKFRREYGKNSESNSGRSRDRKRSSGDDTLYIYGTHAARAALSNPDRVISKVYATRNAADVFGDLCRKRDVEVEILPPQDISKRVGADSVHQGIAVAVKPLEAYALEDIADCDLVVCLDQVTDPHNVGAIIRSAVALGAGAIVMTTRHAPRENGLLAKTASGGLDMIKVVQLPNLAQAITDLKDMGFLCIGLDSEGPEDLSKTLAAAKVSIVLGAEGSGLRRLTRERCDHLACLDMVGPIKSLNVSNAATLSLYMARTYIDEL